MNNKRILLVIGLVCLAVTIFLSVKIFQRHAKGQQGTPQITSSVPNIVITSQGARQDSELPPAVVGEIQNNTGKAIIAIALEAGDETDSAGNLYQDFNSSEPLIAIGGSFAVEMTLANVPPNSSVRICGVMYADNTTEGETRCIEHINWAKEYENSHP